LGGFTAWRFQSAESAPCTSKSVHRLQVSQTRRSCGFLTPLLLPEGRNQLLEQHRQPGQSSACWVTCVLAPNGVAAACRVREPSPARGLITTPHRSGNF